MKNYSSILSGFALQAVEEQILLYDRRLATNTPPSCLVKYLTGTHNLYLRQVPSSQTLRRARTRISKETKPFLLKEGFLHPSMDGGGHPEEVSPTSSWDEGEDHPTPTWEGDDTIVDGPEPAGKNIYEDPWRIFAAWAYSSQYMEERPVINVWPGGHLRVQDRLSPDYFRIEGKNHLHFQDVKGHDERMYFLFNHTHWGWFIQQQRRSGKGNPLRNFCNTLFRRISHFIRGLYDPIWSKEERTSFADYSAPRNKTYRAQRLIEVLKTVDGLFLQRYLSYPEESWDWKKFDLFVVQAISILLTDEFFDGEVSEGVLDTHVTHYEQLKRARKLFKLVIHEDEPSRHLDKLDSQPRWIQAFLRSTWGKAVKHDGFSRLFLAGTLSQTRGSGTPPSLVILRSKRKFIRSVGQVPPAVTQTEVNLFITSLNAVLGELPDHIFTGLGTKARVTVTGSACYEATRKEGGTAQAILTLMGKYEEHQIPLRNLDTGKIVRWMPKDDFESIGTAVFYACLNEVLETDPEELRTVNLTVVKEPGKARVVTKGSAALKIVLDTISKICSSPLKKGFKSSESGMGKSHHGWNLFRDYSSEEIHALLFSEDRKRRVEDVFTDHIDRTQYWQDLWFCSTDYQEATDLMVHRLAAIVARAWMVKCGIPPLLQGIVMAVCFQPRTVIFSATGALKSEGVEVNTDTRRITLMRGVLMGDPLTKVILHLFNITIRRLGQTLASGTIFTHFSNGGEAEERFRQGLSESRSC